MDYSVYDTQTPSLPSGMVDTKMQHLINVFFGKEDKTVSFVTQQGEYNSRRIVATLWVRCSNGETVLMDMSKCHVMVVYQYGTQTTPEYTTEPAGEHAISFVIPQCVVANHGNAYMQLRLYSENALINSATIPFKVLKSIMPSGSYAEDEMEPGLLGVLKQVNEQIAIIKTEVDELTGTAVTYMVQTPTEEEQAQARANIGVEYATEEEIIAMLIAEGIIDAPPAEGVLLIVDDNEDGTISDCTLTVDENQNGTININLSVDEEGNGMF